MQKCLRKKKKKTTDYKRLEQLVADLEQKLAKQQKKHEAELNKRNHSAQRKLEEFQNNAKEAKLAKREAQKNLVKEKKRAEKSEERVTELQNELAALEAAFTQIAAKEESASSKLCEAEQANERTCPICEREGHVITKVYLPCGHACPCKECSADWATRAKVCPQCMSPVADTLRVWLP